jgi:hypothetical protein
MNAFKEFIAAKPKLAQMLGQALFSVGGFLIVCGLIGRAGLVAINAGRVKASLPAFSRISEAYPMYSLWFVPQSAFGYVLPALIAALGIYLAMSAKALLKAQRGGRSRRR